MGLLFEQQGRKRLAYLSDCSGVPDDALAGSVRVEVAVFDALRRRRTRPTCASTKPSRRPAASGRICTLFTHLTHDYDHDRDDAEMPAGVRPAYDGLSLHLPDP